VGDVEILRGSRAGEPSASSEQEVAGMAPSSSQISLPSGRRSAECQLPNLGGNGQRGRDGAASFSSPGEPNDISLAGRLGDHESILLELRADILTLSRRGQPRQRRSDSNKQDVLDGHSSIQIHQGAEMQRGGLISTLSYGCAKFKTEAMADTSGATGSLEAKTNLENYCHCARGNLPNLKTTNTAVVNEFGPLGKDGTRVSEWLKVNSRAGQNEYMTKQQELRDIVGRVYERVLGHA